MLAVWCRRRGAAPDWPRRSPPAPARLWPAAGEYGRPERGDDSAHSEASPAAALRLLLTVMWAGCSKGGHLEVTVTPCCRPEVSDPKRYIRRVRDALHGNHFCRVPGLGAFTATVHSKPTWSWLAHRRFPARLRPWLHGIPCVGSAHRQCTSSQPTSHCSRSRCRHRNPHLQNRLVQCKLHVRTDSVCTNTAQLGSSTALWCRRPVTLALFCSAACALLTLLPETQGVSSASVQLPVSPTCGAQAFRHPTFLACRRAAELDASAAVLSAPPRAVLQPILKPAQVSASRRCLHVVLLLQNTIIQHHRGLYIGQHDTLSTRSAVSLRFCRCLQPHAAGMIGTSAPWATEAGTAPGRIRAEPSAHGSTFNTLPLASITKVGSTPMPSRRVISSERRALHLFFAASL